ncbi:hypothetical protein D917_01711 [Trichinella nativa]|uniref:Uncharacterized protein n=1 Tax=Trichinella nativa TaxID=6335 RepID=A0A1Y3EMI9_9BILA|nr:hypothetical protein D917_01711 [Trichinella nativa]
MVEITDCTDENSQQTSSSSRSQPSVSLLLILFQRKVPANYSVYSLPVFGYAVFFLSKPTYKFNVLNCFMISDIRLIYSFSCCAYTEHI